ncbi:7098_t:CDS:2, partial [Racocetra fulgida]
PKEDVRNVNVGTSSKSKEIAPPFQREPSAVSMEDVEHTKVVPYMEVISATPSIEEIKNNWSREHVINFLKFKKEKKELDVEDQDIKIIEKHRVNGRIFLTLTKEELLKHPYNMVGGPAYEFTQLIETLKGEKDFPDTSIIECNGFKWDMEMDKDKQMQDVKDWFNNVLNLEEGYSVKDVHKSTKKEVTLDKARTILRGGFDIVIGPSLTGCVYIETKRQSQELEAEEAQARGQLLIANANVALDVLVVLTDCNDNSVEKYYIVTAYIDDRGKALGLIKIFVLEQGIRLDKIMGINIRSSEIKEINIRGPFSKKAKFTEDVGFCDERMLDMIPDMTDNEL